MNRRSFLALLPMAYALGRVEGAVANGKPKEPTGGISEMALPERELGPNVRRRVRLLIDSQAEPSVYVFEVPGNDPARAEAADPSKPFKEEMLRMGADAVEYLFYMSAYSEWGPLWVKILRYREASEAEKQWLARRSANEAQVLTIAGREFMYTKPGNMLRSNLRAGFPTLEGKEGRFWVRVAPGGPGVETPAVRFLQKQLEWIRTREPSGPANQSQPVSPQTNGRPAAAASGR